MMVHLFDKSEYDGGEHIFSCLLSEDYEIMIETGYNNKQQKSTFKNRSMRGATKKKITPISCIWCFVGARHNRLLV